VSYRLSAEQIQRKIEHYCVYQDRCEQEVRNKLTQWHIAFEQQNEIVQQLIEDRFLDEERFVQSYVSGKFRMKQWGKVKIKQYLSFKNVAQELIHKAIEQIDPTEYSATLQRLIQQKHQSLSSEKDAWKRHNKIKSYLIGKGYELNAIYCELERYQNE